MTLLETRWILELMVLSQARTLPQQKWSTTTWSVKERKASLNIVTKIRDIKKGIKQKWISKPACLENSIRFYFWRTLLNLLSFQFEVSHDG